MITDSEYKLIYYPKIDKTILYNLKTGPARVKKTWLMIRHTPAKLPN